MKPAKRLPLLLLAALACLLMHTGQAASPRKTQTMTSPDQVPDGLAKSDWQTIRAAYEAGRHSFQATDTGWQARNPGQQWLTIFDKRGFIAQPKDGGWKWGLELQSYGFGENQRTISGTPAVRAEGQRLTYSWNTHMQEWFVNDARGLEHGFTIAERPEPRSARGEAETPNAGQSAALLSFTLAVRGGLQPHVAADALGVEFRDDTGAVVITYSGLKVWDADGKVLPSRFEPSETQPSTPNSQPTLRLLVDERGARYPLTIDPVAQQAYLKASNTEANDRFGWSVAVSGDTVVIGAPYESSNATGVNGNQADNSAGTSGAAYVFTRSGTTWMQQAYLKASNTGAYDLFGYAVAVSGDTVVVGAFGEASMATGVNGNQTNDANLTTGAAYVFTRSGTTWTQQAYLKASNTGLLDWFGHSVAVSGDTIVVGAPQEDSNATGVNGNQLNSFSDSGAAYVFTRSGTTWTQQAYLKASNTGFPDYFGYSVAVSGDTVVIGAYQESSNATGVNGNQADDSAAKSGAAYVFTRSGTTWSQQAYLKASNTGANDFFGYSVAVSGDTVVVGAHGESSNATGVNGNQADNSFGNSGAAYVFTRNGTTWIQQAYLKASNAEYDRFGSSVAVSGDTAVVGALYEASNTTGVNGNQADNSATDSGAAYVFTRSGTTWTQQAYLKASNTGASDLFGRSVAVSRDTVVVGALAEDGSAMGLNGTPNETAPDAGAAYIFTGVGAVQSPIISMQSLTVHGNGSFQFAFTNVHNTSFSVLATTNIGLPSTNWTVLSTATNTGGGIYQFTDPGATNHPQRFYQLRGQ